jgi:hypothetical protein
MTKPLRRYKVTNTKSCGGTPITRTGTLPELIVAFSYTLDCGRSYQHEKGNKKINCNPTTIKSLISNLNNAVNNSAANGYAGVTYSAEMLTSAVEIV